MPNRIIKETICTSEEIDSLTTEEEVFFYRLMVNCDDFGLFDGRAKIIASKCYPLKSIDINRIQLMLSSLVRVGLVSIYEVDGKPYLAISKWAEHQQIRAKRAKFPMPSDGNPISLDINCNQSQANAPVIQSNPIQSESNPNPKESGAERADVSEVFEFWKSEMDHGRAVLDAKRRKLIASRLSSGYTVEDLKTAIIGCKLSPYHMGENESGTRYDSLELILRDSGKVDQFIGYYRSPPVARGSQKQQSDSAFLAAIGLSGNREERVITGEVLS